MPENMHKNIQSFLLTYEPKEVAGGGLSVAQGSH